MSWRMFLLVLSIVKAELHFKQDKTYWFEEDNNDATDIYTRNKVKHLNVYSYIAAILLVDQILSTGTLINEKWVISGAERLFVNRNNMADITARFGSQDYASSGILIAISSVEIHPYYRLGKPDYDLSMLRLSHAMLLAKNIKPLKLPPRGEELVKSHFLIPVWTKSYVMSNRWNYSPQTNDKSSRRLKLLHLHSSEADDCSRFVINVSTAQNIMCLFSADKKNSCEKNGGGPLVSRGQLWGITSSFAPEDCDAEETPTFVVMLTAPEILVWLNTVMKSQSWRRKVQINYFTSNDEDVTLLEQGF